MRAVFINQCHPQMPHVCSLRVGRFAEAMAARGHEIVLLVEAYPRDAPCPSPERVAADFATHDWATPYVLPCRPVDLPKLRRARAGKGNALVRYATILKSFLADGGMFADWRVGAEAYGETLAKTFRPDVVWSTFGNTDSWTMAQHLAELCGCPWVADFKDNWSAFVPDGLKFVMAKRLGNAAQMTVLSESHCDEAERWFPGVKSVLYSGVDPAPAGEDPQFTVLLAGSVYSENRLAQFIWGLREWLGKAGRDDVVFCYAGNDGKLVERVSTPLDEFCERRFLGFVEVAELARLQRRAHVNVYIHNERCLFHHKALELVAAGRPILSYPDESPETRRLAAEAGSALFVCEDRDQIVDAMDVVDQGNFPPGDAAASAQYTWQARAEILETVLSRVIGRSA